MRGTGRAPLASADRNGSAKQSASTLRSRVSVAVENMSKNWRIRDSVAESGVWGSVVLSQKRSRRGDVRRRGHGRYTGPTIAIEAVTSTVRRGLSGHVFVPNEHGRVPEGLPDRVTWLLIACRPGAAAA